MYEQGQENKRPAYAFSKRTSNRIAQPREDLGSVAPAALSAPGLVREEIMGLESRLSRESTLLKIHGPGRVCYVAPPQSGQICPDRFRNLWRWPYFFTLRKPDRFARLCFGISGPGRTPEPEPLRSGPELGQNRPQELHFEHFCVQARNLARIGLRSFILSISVSRPGTWPE